jgi:hypothetical protein
MTTEFSYIAGVKKKIGRVAILAPIAKGSFGNKK